jgi:hypothetical protein
MTARLRSPLFILLFLACTLGASAQSKDPSEKWMPLYQAVENILAGKPIADGNIVVGKEAYLVYGASYQSLPGVMKGEFKNITLVEDTSRKSGSITMKINDREEAAYMTLMTETKANTERRYHTIVFMKDDKGRWVLNAWHTSNS